MDAGFYTEPENKEEGERGRGRPRKVGKRLLSPQQLVADESIPWEEHSLFMYRRKVTFLTKAQVGLRCDLVGVLRCGMLVSRGPAGRF